jgi:predicted TPR repeat methyltransferase
MADARRDRVAENDESIMPELNTLYNAESLETLRAHYDAWAQHYEEDAKLLGRMLPPIVAGMVGKHAPAGCVGPVMDVGCGTGVMGQILTTLGYGPVDGIDLSPGMLEVAAQKSVYRGFHEAAIGPDRLQITTGHYSMCIAVGVFTLGHAGPEAFDELVRVTRRGGVLIFSASMPVLDDAFQAKIQRLCDQGKWRLLEASPPFPTLLNSPDRLEGRVFAYERT